MKTLITIDYRLKIADRKVRLLSRLNPLNAKSESRKFFAARKRGEVYNPAFRYRSVQTDLAALAAELKRILIKIPPSNTERRFFAQHLLHKRCRIIAKINAVKYLGNLKFKNHSRKLFGCPSSRQVAYARRLLKSSSWNAFSEINDTLSAGEAAASLQKYLSERGLPWQVKIRTNISSKAGLDSRSQYLLVKAGEKFAPEEILSLAVHEIETHIYRRENGAHQNFPGLFTEGFAGPPTTEEGLALFNELEHNYDPRRFNIICARTLAIALAQRKSFFYVFNKLQTYGLPAPYSWAITLRAKRGFRDTSRPGAFSKDHHYLKGYLEVKKFIADGGNIESLYIGKLNINNVKSLNRLKIGVREPKYLPIHYDNRSFLAQAIL